MESDSGLTITVAHRLDGVGEYYFSRKLREIDAMRSAGREVINLGIGSPDRPPHASVTAAMAAEAAKPGNHAYQSYIGAAVLREAFAGWYERYYGVGLDPRNEILPLIGSKEGLMHIFMTYLNPGDRVLIPNPGYPTYRSAATIAGGVCVDYRLTAENDWQPDLEGIERAGVEGVKIMVLNYPHMPTGAAPAEGLFERLVAFARRHNILLVHDNPYSFVRNDTPRSLLAVGGAMDVALELNSLSKSHNMAGWRVGMVAGSAQRLSEIIRFKSNMDSGMFFPMQAAAATALALGGEWYAELNGEYYRREKAAHGVLDALGCSYGERQSGLFVWAGLPEGYEGDCYVFADTVLDRTGVFITPGGIFGSEGDRYIRISLCATIPVLERAAAKIREARQ